jgi:hypothetical protein
MPFRKSFTLFFLLSLFLVFAGCGSGGGGTITSSPSSNGGANTPAGIGGTSTGIVSLAWDAPTTRADGTPLNPATDLQAYKLYYGSSSRTYTQSVRVTNPGTVAISYTLTLPTGTYYFTVTAVDQFGNESGGAGEVSKTI